MISININPITDTANASVVLVKALGELIGSVASVLQEQKASRLTKEVDQLTFKNDAISHHLHMIANGRGVNADYDAIEKKLNDTVDQIEESLRQLSRQRDFMVKKYGPDKVDMLNIAIYKKGKLSIRDDISMLLMKRDSYFSPEDVSNEATIILDKIQTVNKDLFKVINLMRGYDDNPAHSN